MHVRRALRASLATASLAALAAFALAGCTSDSDGEAKSPAPSGPSVLVPGLPGEENRTLSAEEAAAQQAEDDTPNSADVSYVRRMIEHHEQAVVMAELAPKQAKSTQVKRLAERIKAAQAPEIGAMRGWLETHGKAEPGEEVDGEDGGHDHAAMPGMATEAQLGQLRAARGEVFDTLFLKLMIAHHQGAITMATEVKGQGNNIQVEEMADDVVAQQTSEITRMRDMI
ncbi:DUF305 domain-containing protein [Streptomyces sp. enrichment culture]|uniref:DUF305 domain-containing protein n=1 Tax=Streptomyces sp. enrichment culture TaxID=1795815 RepID=UPI003F57ABE9